MRGPVRGSVRKFLGEVLDHPCQSWEVHGLRTLDSHFDLGGQGYGKCMVCALVTPTLTMGDRVRRLEGQRRLRQGWLRTRQRDRDCSGGRAVEADMNVVRIDVPETFWCAGPRLRDVRSRADRYSESTVRVRVCSG